MENFLLSLLGCSLSMTMIGILYIAASPPLHNRFTAKGRYYGWLAIIIGFIIPFRLHPFASVISMDTVLSMLGHVDSSSMNQTVSAHSVAAPAITWVMMGGGVWIAGMLVFTVYHFTRHRRFLHLVNRWSEKCTNERAIQLLHTSKANLNIARKVELRICPGIASPMLVGFVRPFILLPSVGIPDRELRFILSHELVHLKRGDTVCKMLVFAATALHWFNPFVYRMAREVALQCELSCDEEVIRHADIKDRQHYVEAIINVMKNHSRGSSVFSASFSDSRLSIRKRVHSIMDTRSKKRGISLLVIIVLATIGIGAFFSLSPAHDQEGNSEANRRISASGDELKPEDTGTTATQIDTDSQADVPEKKQDESAFVPDASKQNISTSDDSFLLIPDSNSESQPPASTSGQSVEGDSQTLVMFAGPGISIR